MKLRSELEISFVSAVSKLASDSERYTANLQRPLVSALFRSTHTLSSVPGEYYYQSRCMSSPSAHSSQLIILFRVTGKYPDWDLRYLFYNQMAPRLVGSSLHLMEEYQAIFNAHSIILVTCLSILTMIPSDERSYSTWICSRWDAGDRFRYVFPWVFNICRPLQGKSSVQNTRESFWSQRERRSSPTWNGNIGIRFTMWVTVH